MCFEEENIRGKQGANGKDGRGKEKEQVKQGRGSAEERGR